MKQKNNLIIDFFASVKLALFVLFILAVTSIIGTIIPQSQMPEKYIEMYGENTSRLFHLLDFTDMYHSWWFLSLLTLLSINLIVCTLKRLPHVWQTVVQDNLATPTARLQKMAPRRSFVHSGPDGNVVATAKNLLAQTSRNVQERTVGEETILFTQKGAWTRFGVYVVHLSILVIFVGAIIGSVYGFKAFVMIPAGSTTDRVFETGTGTPLDLGFILRCDSFHLEYYDTGAPKEFRSELAVVKDGTEILQKSIVVNDPLHHEGITFYQASYQAMEGQLFARVTNTQTGASTGLPLKPRMERAWTSEGVRFGVTNYEAMPNSNNYRFKIWFSDGKGEPSHFWMNFGATAKIERADTVYDFDLAEHFATGLQVAKDPGVWWVYVGCGLMLFGITVAFFLSHRRIWAVVKAENGQTTVLICGSTNKNKLGFEKEFETLVKHFAQHEHFTAQG